jgi:hypothetical protein
LFTSADLSAVLSVPQPVLSEEEQRKNKEAHLVSDKIALDQAKKLLSRTSTEVSEVQKTLKTPAAKTVLAEMLRESTVKISDVESTLEAWSKRLPAKYPLGRVDYLLLERFRDAFSKATTVLMNHVTAGILVGSSDEQSDLETLLNYLIKIAPHFDHDFEIDAFYSAISDRYSACYDAVSKNDVISRSKILQKVLGVSDKAFRNASDGDDFEIGYNLVDVAENYIAAVRLWFVEKTHPTVMTYVFKDQKTFERFERFSVKAPDLFRYCKSNTQATIEAQLWKDGWSYWEQKGYQTIWVNYEGDTSLRIKDDGEFTVGFLSENPYFSNGSLDRVYLGDRSSELVKSALVSGCAFFNPASLNDAITGFWTARTKHLQVLGGKKVMDFGHDKVK